MINMQMDFFASHLCQVADRRLPRGGRGDWRGKGVEEEQRGVDGGNYDGKGRGKSKVAGRGGAAGGRINIEEKEKG